MTTTVAITLPYPAPPGLADQLSGDFGVYPHIDQASRTIDPTPAGVVVATALGLFVSGMVQQFGAEAANHLLRGLGRLRHRAPQDGRRDLQLIDEANDVVIVVGAEALTEHAMTALLTLDWERFRPGDELHWDPATGRWHDATRATW